MTTVETKEFGKREVCLDYDFEEVMARSLPSGKCYLKFYGKEEIEVKENHIMFNEVLRFGDEISKNEYEKGKPRTY